MNRIIQKLRYKKSFIIFIFLEFCSFILIINSNKSKENYIQGPLHIIISYINDRINFIKQYPMLKEVNGNLIEENKLLRQIIYNKEEHSKQNKSYLSKYEIIPAKVVKNSIIYSKNYITVNKGEKEGIKPEMGVISSEGIVGKIKYVSKNFATIVPILHIKSYTSAMLEESGVFGTIKWMGKDPSKVNLLYIPKHAKIKLNEKVITSGYNSIFPKGIVIGKIMNIQNKKSNLFYQIILNLETNFNSLNQVYIIKNNFKDEKIIVEQKTKNFYE